MDSLFFNRHFAQEFTWKNRFRLRVGSVLPENKKQISDGLRFMSPESIRNRFLASKRAFSDQELQYLTTLDGWNHYAIGIEENEHLKRGIAIIRMVRSSVDEAEAEVAITIIDDFQKMGLGTFLMNLIILAAVERKVTRLSFTFLPQNEGILRLISHVGIPLPGTYNKDYEQLYLDLKTLSLEKIKSQLAKTLPGIETFHSEI